MISKEVFFCFCGQGFEGQPKERLWYTRWWLIRQTSFFLTKEPLILDRLQEPFFFQTEWQFLFFSCNPSSQIELRYKSNHLWRDFTGFQRHRMPVQEEIEKTLMRAQSRVSLPSASKNGFENALWVFDLCRGTRRVLPSIPNLRGYWFHPRASSRWFYQRCSYQQDGEFIVIAVNQEPAMRHYATHYPYPLMGKDAAAIQKNGDYRLYTSGTSAVIRFKDYRGSLGRGAMQNIIAWSLPFRAMAFHAKSTWCGTCWRLEQIDAGSSRSI